MSQTCHHKILIVGGGTAGIIVAAQLRRAGQSDIAILEPSERHFYQPLWTLVGGGAAAQAETVGREADYIPAGVTWIRDSAAEADPDANRITTASGAKIGYDFLVAAPGMQLNWDAIPGLREALRRDNVSTNYAFDMAPRTWAAISAFKGGVALFHMPGTPVKCPGAPQKIMYLAADRFRRAGIGAQVIYGSATPSIFGVKEYAAVLDRVVERYGIDARYGHELIEIRPESNEAVFRTKDGSGDSRVTIPYDLLHVVPPQSAPDFIRRSPLAAPNAGAFGGIDVDQFTMRHKRYANVFALGDAAGTPNPKTGASAMKQAPVVVVNLLAAISGQESAARYNGYVACPVVTGYGKMLLCEYDYSGKPAPTIPLIDTMRERYSMWLLKRYGLPWLYWHVMLRGRDMPFLGARAMRERALAPRTLITPRAEKPV
jgi:sulfide:quinone oxidoreductase